MEPGEISEHIYAIPDDVKVTYDSALMLRAIGL